jgi:quinol monooxygenase YgiN
MSLALQNVLTLVATSVVVAAGDFDLRRNGEVMIYVVATIELAEGTREAFVAEQRKLLPLVRAEAGCIEYVPTVDVAVGDPPKTALRVNCIVMQEKWETLANLQAHAVAPHMKDFRAKTKHMIVSTKVEVFEPI